jgi:hypothetical protein
MLPLGTTGYSGYFRPPHYSFCGRNGEAAVGLLARASATICDAGIAECAAVLQDVFDPCIRPHHIRNQPHHA